MAKAEIKKQLLEYIEMIEDESLLQMLNDAAEVYATKQPDIIDMLTPEQLNRLQESVKQANEGKLTSHKEVKKISSQWLTKYWNASWSFKCIGICVALDRIQFLH